MKKFKSKASLGAVMAMVITGGSLFGGLAAEAAGATPSFNLDQMVVTATRTEKAIIDTPANTTVITAKDLKDGAYHSVFEAVRNLAQANAHTYQDDGGDYGGMMSRVRVRGIDSGTLVLVNGNPSTYMNNATLSNIPIDQIEKIEVVKGSGSVLYGPQAMGGVINIITKRPEKTGKVSGNAYGSLGSLKKEAGINVRTDFINIGFKEDWNKDVDNAVLPGTTGRGTAINYLDKKSKQLYLDANLAKNLTFGYSRVNKDVTYESGSYVNFNPVMNKLGVFKNTYDNYSLVYDNREDGLKVAAGYNKINIDGKYDKSYSGGGTDSEYNGYNLNFDVQKKFSLNNAKDSLVVGLNTNREAMEQFGAKYNSNGRNSYSLYQSYDFNPSDKVEIILGLREYYMGKTEYQDSNFQLLPQIQGLYKINDTANYYFNVGKSFEMPSISSAFYYSDNYLINTDLKPQSGWSYELGYKYEKDKHAFTADVFHMNVKDKFYWDKDSTGASIMRNRDQWKNTGVELNYKQIFDDNWVGNVGLTMQNPVGESKGAWTQDTAKYILNVGASYTQGKFLADARVFSYLAREDAYYNYEHTSSSKKDHKLKDSIDLTLNLAYKPTKFDTFSVVGRNLLNREDALNNYEYRTTPRNITFTYERSF